MITTPQTPKKRASRAKIKKPITLLVVLVSGGRSSAMMARHIQTSEKYAHFEKCYVFCNTGQERPETVTFLKNIMQYWQIPLNVIEGLYSQVPSVGVKSRVVTLDTMDMTGAIFSNAIAHLNKLKWTGVPNPATPYCSEYLKTRVAHHFTKQFFGTTKYIKAIGFRAEDMPKRITLVELKHDKKRIAPLLTDFETPITQGDLNIYFDKEPFKLEIHSKLTNCELCWKKSTNNLIDCIQYGTRFIEWHQKEEQLYGNMFFRDNLSINDIVKLAESGTQTKLFDDVGDGCICNF